MEDTTLKIIIEAVNNAEAALKGVGLNLEAATGASKAVALGLAAATTAVVAFGIKAIASAQEVELAQNQLEHAILAVSGGTKEQVVEVNNLIDALERKGVIDGDNLKIGVAQLSTFGLSTKLVKDLVPAIADLTVNQFGVSASGDQFAQSANMIQKALNGQFGVLEKSGIRFTEAQQKLIKFGTESERSSALLEGFNQNLKLTNETARQTSAGAMQALKVSFGNITEGIGAKLLPILAVLMEKLNVFATNTLPQFIEKVEEITSWLLEHKVVLAMVAGAIVGALVPAFIAWAAAAWSAAAAAVAAMIPLLPFIAIGAAVAAAIYGIYWAFTNWGKIMDFITPVWDTIVSFIQDQINILTNILTLNWGAFEESSNGFLIFLYGLNERFGGWINMIRGIFSTLFNILTFNWGAFEESSNAFLIFLFGISERVGNGLNIIKAAFLAVWDGLVLMFDIALAVILGSLQMFFSIWGTDIDTVLNFITNLFTTFWNGAKALFTVQIDIIKNVWKLWWDSNKLVVDVGTKAITGLAKAMWDALVIVWNGIKTGLGAIWTALWDAMGSRVISTWDSIKQTIKNSINSIVDLVNRIISSINEAKSKVKSLGAVVPDIPLIPRLAKGGIVTGPTIAMIGEAGPEAVVPLSGGLAGAGVGGVTINFNGTFGFSESVAEDLCDMVINAVKGNIKI